MYGLEVAGASIDEFRGALTRENHTLKRALTDPRLIAGIGNAYSDEILHRARLSPVKLTSRLSDSEIETLLQATCAVLAEWTERSTSSKPDARPEPPPGRAPPDAAAGAAARRPTQDGSATAAIESFGFVS
jgi:formamidopyrimidine-DNA glycosylase